MNINDFAAFISYLATKSGSAFDSYECNTVLNYLEKFKDATVSCEAVDELLKAMQEANVKIPAIKAYRALTGADLRTAKDNVEKYYVPKGNN